MNLPFDKRLFFGLVLAALVIAGVSYRLSTRPSADDQVIVSLGQRTPISRSAESDTLATRNTPKVAGASHPPPVLSSKGLGSLRPFSGVRTLSELERQIGDRWTSDPNAYYALDSLSHECGSYSDFLKTVGDWLDNDPAVFESRPELTTASESYYAKWITSACAADVSGAKERLRSIPFPFTTLELGQGPEIDPQTGKIKANAALSKKALEVIYSPASTWREFEVASGYLVSSAGLDWNDGETDKLRGTRFYEHFRTLQSTALDLVSCDISGGCGRDEFRSIVACRQLRVCAPGVTFEYAVSQTFAPIEFAVILAIARNVRAHRAGLP